MPPSASNRPCGGLRFSASVSGAAPEPQTFSVFKEGEKILRWSARESTRWNGISPASGTKEEDIEVRVDPSSLDIGTHTGTIAISSPTAPNSPRRVEVIFEKQGMPLYAGFRSSRYGIDPFPTPSYWTRTAKEMARRVGGAAPAGIWIVGVSLDDGTCELNFPGLGGSFPGIVFLAEDQNEEFMTAFDAEGTSLWLQAERSARGDRDCPPAGHSQSSWAHLGRFHSRRSVPGLKSTAIAGSFRPSMDKPRTGAGFRGKQF